MLRHILLPLALSLFALSCSAQEADQPEYSAGQHYEVIERPVAKTTPREQFEVAEFFWYGCKHCYTFESMVGRWKKDLAEDVAFRYIPAVWRQDMELHARAFYAADALGVAETLHPAIFQAMHVDGKALTSQREIAAVFVANGVSEAEFNKAFTSFGVNSQVSQAVAAAKGAGLTGTPSMMVEGKYLITASKAGGQAEMLEVADFLVAKEREARAVTVSQ